MPTQGNWLNARTYTRCFDSYTEFLATATSPLDPAISGDKPRRSQQTRSAKDKVFLGTPTFEAAADLAHKGWPGGREEMMQLTASILDRLTPSIGERHVTTLDVTGECCDNGAFSMGVPECMMAFETEPAENCPNGKIVTVALDYGGNGNITREQFLLRGAAMLAVIDALELTGFQVEVLARKGTGVGSDGKGGWGKTYLVEFPVKKAGETMDPDRLAFVAGHPSMLRRLGWSMSEHEPVKVRDTFGFSIGGGYGNAISHPGTFDVQAPALADITEASTLEWVTSQLERFGVLVSENSNS